MYKFKDGDRILVTNEDEYKKLCGMLDEQGYEWAGGNNLLGETECSWDCITANIDKVLIYVYKDGNSKYVTWDNVIPYSAISTADEPELTAVESIQAQAEMCVTEGCCNECPLNRVNEPLPVGMRSCAHYCSLYPDKALKIIKEYHYKKTLCKDFEFAAQICEERGCPSAAAELRAKAKDIAKGRE